MYFDTKWSCRTSPWKIVITCPLVLHCCSSQELEDQSRRLQETLSDILKLAHVGAEFQRFVSFVNSCDFALFACLLRAWIAALSMKLGEATVEETRRNDYKNKWRRKRTYMTTVTYLWHADLLFFTDVKVKSINWWSSSEDRELTRHEGLGPAKPRSTWSLNAWLLLSAAKMTWLSYIPSTREERNIN